MYNVNSVMVGDPGEQLISKLVTPHDKISAITSHHLPPTCNTTMTSNPTNLRAASLSCFVATFL